MTGAVALLPNGIVWFVVAMAWESGFARAGFHRAASSVRIGYEVRANALDLR